MKNSDELLKWNEKMVLPLFLHDLIMRTDQVMKGSSFTSVKNSFDIIAAKFVPYFEGQKD